MRTRSQLALAALAATVLLSMAVFSASANRLSINERLFRITWTSLEFVEETFGIRILCPVTLEGSFHSQTISKVIGALIGYVTRATAHTAACTGARVSVQSETLPWHVTYEGFRGTLPNITAIRILLVNPKFRLEAAGINCTAGNSNPNAEIETGVREAGGPFKPDNVIPDPASSIPCGILSGHFGGTGRITKSNAAEKLLIKLI